MTSWEGKCLGEHWQEVSRLLMKNDQISGVWKFVYLDKVYPGRNSFPKPIHPIDEVQISLDEECSRCGRWIYLGGRVCRSSQA